MCLFKLLIVVFKFVFTNCGSSRCWVSQTNNYGGQCKRVGEWYKFHWRWSHPQTTVTSCSWTASKEDWVSSTRKQGSKDRTGNLQVEMQDLARREERTSESQCKYCKYLLYFWCSFSFLYTFVVNWVNALKVFHVVMAWCCRS